MKDEIPVMQHKGKYPRECTLIASLHEYRDLVNEAKDIVLEYAEFVGCGPAHKKCKDWMRKHYSILDEEIRVLTTGDDWRGL